MGKATPRDTPDARWAREDECIRFQLQMIRAASGMELAQIGKAIGLSPSTIYERLHRPGTLRVSEMRMLESFARRFGLRVDWTNGPESVNITREASA